VKLALAAALFGCLGARAARAADWPTYRADAARSGYTPEPLHRDLALAWVYRAQVPQPAWPSAAWQATSGSGVGRSSSDRLTFDRVYHPVVAGGVLCFGSSADGELHALDAATGDELWSFFTDGPVRLAPVFWDGRVYAASDDGFLYSLDARSGELLWKKRGGPDARSVLGNDRMCSAWPARGGPVLAGGIVYWAAGIWPSDGVFVYAHDALSGAEVWRNDADGFRYFPQPHTGAGAMSGIAAQGHLAAGRDRLYVPTGRAVPAALARADGKLAFFHLQDYGHTGGSLVTVFDSHFHNGGGLFDATSGRETEKLPGLVARLGEQLIQVTAKEIAVHRWQDKESVDRKGDKVKFRGVEKLWQIAADGPSFEVIAAGSSIVVGGEDRVRIIGAESQQVAWSAEVDGRAYGLAVAAGRLYASTDKGFIYCFTPPTEPAGVTGTAGRRPVRFPARPRALPLREPRWADAADAILAATGIREGYCLDLGCGDGGLALELARQSALSVYCVDPDPARVEAARRKLDEAGLYGVRVTVHHRELARTGYPRFFANLIVSGRAAAGEDLAIDAAEIERMSRPWGGTVCLGPPAELRITRRGPLDGAGSWTHQYADPANTCSSGDALVRGPLRMLWFRDADLRMPQRHGRAPAPLFQAGVLVVEGRDALRAADPYNGRTLWERELPGILRPYDQDHLMGTAGTGSNLCADGASVYVHRKAHCLRLDLASGRTLAELTPPAQPDGKPGVWGYLACADGLLYGTVADTEHLVKWRYLEGDMSGMFSESRLFFAMDPDTGAIRWQYPAVHSLRHNSIAIGGGRVYLIDREVAKVDALSYRRGEGEPEPVHATGVLVAVDAKTGKLIWKTEEEVFGTVLAVEVAEEALLMAYQPTRFGLPSEKGDRMAVFHTRDGYRLWDKKVEYASRPLVNAPTIYAEGGAWDLRTGVDRPFEFQRSYGCGILAGGKHLMVFRSATLGYAEFAAKAETRNYGGLRLGCWINAIPAGGIVLVPDGSAGCQCSYLNQASLALEPAE
jgi:outer membrane protein assembly factor BamB